MSAPPTIAQRIDRSEPMKDSGFFMEMNQLTDGRRQISCDNTNGKLQITLVLEFKEPSNLELLCEQAKREYGTRYSLTLYPGESYDFLRAMFRGMKRELKGGTPDGEWLAKQASKVNDSLTTEVSEMQKRVTEEWGLALSAVAKDSEQVAQLCEQNGIPFLDVAFPPGQQSLARSHEKMSQIYPWSRASVFVGEMLEAHPSPSGGHHKKEHSSPGKRKPCLYVGNIEPEDIDQGRLGDCYFLCALACLSEFPDLVKAMYKVPQCHDLGIFRVRMCKDGWWQGVVLDEYLPVNPTTKFPVFAQNREEPDELWVAMAEKAYAKIYGSYAAIKGGDSALALFDLIGLPYERFQNRVEWGNTASHSGHKSTKDPTGQAMWDILMEADQSDCIMTLSTPPCDADTDKMRLKMLEGKTDPTAVRQRKLCESNLEQAKQYEAVGLATGHSFSLIRIKETSSGDKLCMIRNPWGDDKEWNGAWSDKDPRWTPQLRKEMGFYEGDDGTFWQSWDDVRKWYLDGTVSYNIGSWSQLRVATELNYGAPSLMLKLTVASDDTPVWIGAHQADTRGLESVEVDAKLAHILLVVMRGPTEYGRMEKVATPMPEAFLNLRDVFCKATLNANTPHYVVVQGFHDDLASKKMVYSVYSQDPSSVDVTFLSYREGQGQKFNPVTKFDPKKTERTSNTSTIRRPPVRYQTMQDVNSVPVNHSGFKPSNWGGFMSSMGASVLGGGAGAGTRRRSTVTGESALSFDAEVDFSAKSTDGAKVGPSSNEGSRRSSLTDQERLELDEEEALRGKDADEEFVNNFIDRQVETMSVKMTRSSGNLKKDLGIGKIVDPNEDAQGGGTPLSNQQPPPVQNRSKGGNASPRFTSDEEELLMREIEGS